MNKTELAIADISGAELIKYYFMPDGVLGLLVIKGSEVFNLSEGEKYFDSLEQAALIAYASCAEAAADELTRKLLSERSSAALLPMLGRYENIDGACERSQPFEKDKVSSLLPMAEYYLEMIYHRLGYKTSFTGELKGYRKKYSLSFRLNDERKTIPFSFKDHGSGFEMVFGNFIDTCDSVRLFAKYSFGMVLVTADVSCQKHLRAENTFDVIHKTEALRIFDEAEIVYNSSKAIVSTHDEIAGDMGMICTDQIYETMQLPWGRAYFNEQDNKREMIIFQKSHSDTNGFIYHSIREYLSDDKRIVTDSITAVHEIFFSDGKRKICTRFLPTESFSKGIYKQKYENRYFYRSINDDMGGRKNGG